MIEVLVWILIATGGGNQGSSIMQPIYFKNLQQCEHVANSMTKGGSIINTPKCIQANIYIQGK